MPQITLSVPSEKLPMLQEFLQALGIEGNDHKGIFRNSRKNTNSVQTSTSDQPFSWEYYCNELEFE